jgi:hypothetical protein
MTIRFRGRPIETRETRLLIVDKQVLLAPIAVREITPRLKGRFRQYLRLLGLDLGLIANIALRQKSHLPMSTEPFDYAQDKLCEGSPSPKNERDSSLPLVAQNDRPRTTNRKCVTLAV